MVWIVASMKWIMLVSGALTCTMLYAAVAPQAALQSTCGETLQGPVAEIVVRNWGVLIGLMGVMLIYGAFNVAARPLVLILRSEQGDVHSAHIGPRAIVPWLSGGRRRGQRLDPGVSVPWLLASCQESPRGRCLNRTGPSAYAQGVSAENWS